MYIFRKVGNNRVRKNRLKNHIIHPKKTIVWCTWFKTPTFNDFYENNTNFCQSFETTNLKKQKDYS